MSAVCFLLDYVENTLQQTKDDLDELKQSKEVTNNKVNELKETTEDMEKSLIATKDEVDELKHTKDDMENSPKGQSQPSH